MNQRVRRIAMVSMHTSPADAPGVGDAGGMNVAILALAEGLAARGMEVDLVSRAVREPEVTAIAEHVTLRTLAAGPLEPLPKRGLAGVADEFGEAVAKLVGRSSPRYDLIHSHYWLSGLATLPVALELGLPMVQSFHTLGAMKNRMLAAGDEPEPEARLRGEAFLSSQVDAIVAGSAAEVTSLIDELRAPADRLWVIPPGVDIELFSPERAADAVAVRESLGLPPARPLLVIAGRAIDESYQRRLETTASELGVAADVRFVGALDRGTLARLFAAASLTLVPSHSETFGLVALETASSGTPVVAFRGSGLRESVADGESGILVGSREPREWAAAIAALLGDESRLAKLGASARGFAEGFTWATAAASLLAVYESLARR